MSKKVGATKQTQLKNKYAPASDAVALSLPFFMDGFIEWLDTDEGQTSLEATEVVHEELAGAQLDLDNRKIIWSDGTPRDVRETIETIAARHDLPIKSIASHVLGWAENHPFQGEENINEELEDKFEEWMESVELPWGK